MNMKKIISMCMVLLCLAVLVTLPSCKPENKPDNTPESTTEASTESTAESESFIEQNFRLLKNCDTKALVGFDFGDDFDAERVGEAVAVENTADGESFKPKDEQYSDVVLHFTGMGDTFYAMATYYTGSFFGVNVGEDKLEKISEILGEPDKYEEHDDMDGLPSALYDFGKALLFIGMTEDGTISKIVYKDGASSLEEDFRLLKRGNTNAIVGFDFGDDIDTERVEKSLTADAYILKDGRYSDVSLHFTGTGNTFFAMATYNTGSFFGVNVGEDRLKKISGIWGKPDIEEMSDMDGFPTAIYHFDTATVFISMTDDGVITKILYKHYGGEGTR